MPPTMFTGAVPVGNSPVALAVDERAGHVFVANQVDGTVSVLDARSGRVIRTVPVGTAPVAVAVDARTGRAFVVNSNVFPTGTISGPSSVSVLDTHTGALVRTVAVGQRAYTLAIDERAYTLAIDERANRVFVVNGDSDSVNVLDARTGQALHTIPAGLGPRSIAVDAGAGRIFLARLDGTVQVLDSRTGQLIRHLTAGTEPSAIALDARTGQLFVTNMRDGGASQSAPAWGWVPQSVRRWIPWLAHPATPRANGTGTVSVIATAP